MITHTSTAGRETTHPNETNDCVVVALAHVLGCPYAEAHEIFAEQHAFAYVDGQLLDNLHKSKMRANMTSCWKVSLPEPEVKQDLSQSDISEMWERLDKIKF